MSRVLLRSLLLQQGQISLAPLHDERPFQVQAGEAQVVQAVLNLAAVQVSTFLMKRGQISELLGTVKLAKR